MGKPHLGGNNMGAIGTHSVSLPGTGHQAPISFTQALGYQALVNQAPSNLSPVSQALVDQAPGN